MLTVVYPCCDEPLRIIRFGYHPGTVPPVALRTPGVQVIIDKVAASWATELDHTTHLAGAHGWPVQLSPHQHADESSATHNTSAPPNDNGSGNGACRRYVCGAGAESLVFVANLPELTRLTQSSTSAPATITANVTDMTKFLHSERARASGSGEHSDDIASIHLHAEPDTPR